MGEISLPNIIGKWSKGNDEALLMLKTSQTHFRGLPRVFCVCGTSQPGSSLIKLSNSIQNVSKYIYNVTRISDLNVENNSTAFNYIGQKECI